MKNILFLIAVISSSAMFAQIRTNNSTNATITNQSAFLDASAGTFSTSVNNGKGLAFPRTNLTTFTFERDGNALAYSTRYDGMIVYNTATGNTPAAGAGIRSGIGSQAMTPGFYYFSNPTAASVVGNGRWLRMDGADLGTKTREVIKTIEVGATTATVDLTSGDNSGQGMAGVTVNQFIGAKIYNNATGQLQMDASSSYVDGTAKILTTGNGFISQVLPAGTYKFVIEYK